MIIPDQSLEAYLGSRHSALGLVLAWLGLPAIGLGLMGLAAPDEIPQWVSIVLVIWGAAAFPLGLAMRRKKPPRPLWVMANALLWLTVLIPTFLILERFSDG